ncbi:hypothetical protein L6R50_10885 [Myxococcota bacterium]|nr:hypothetical protein [Myxococcota bacterium]
MDHHAPPRGGAAPRRPGLPLAALALASLVLSTGRAEAARSDLLVQVLDAETAITVSRASAPYWEPWEVAWSEVQPRCPAAGGVVLDADPDAIDPESLCPEEEDDGDLLQCVGRYDVQRWLRVRARRCLAAADFQEWQAMRKRTLALTDHLVPVGRDAALHRVEVPWARPFRDRAADALRRALALGSNRDLADEVLAARNDVKRGDEPFLDGAARIVGLSERVGARCEMAPQLARSATCQELHARAGDILSAQGDLPRARSAWRRAVAAPGPLTWLSLYLVAHATREAGGGPPPCAALGREGFGPALKSAPSPALAELVLADAAATLAADGCGDELRGILDDAVGLTASQSPDGSAPPALPRTADVLGHQADDLLAALRQRLVARGTPEALLAAVIGDGDEADAPRIRARDAADAQRAYGVREATRDLLEQVAIARTRDGREVMLVKPRDGAPLGAVAERLRGHTEGRLAVLTRWPRAVDPAREAAVRALLADAAMALLDADLVLLDAATVATAEGTARPRRRDSADSGSMGAALLARASLDLDRGRAAAAVEAVAEALPRLSPLSPGSPVASRLARLAASRRAAAAASRLMDRLSRAPADEAAGPLSDLVAAFDRAWPDHPRRGEIEVAWSTRLRAWGRAVEVPAARAGEGDCAVLAGRAALLEEQRRRLAARALLGDDPAVEAMVRDRARTAFHAAGELWEACGERPEAWEIRGRSIAALAETAPEDEQSFEAAVSALAELTARAARDPAGGPVSISLAWPEARQVEMRNRARGIGRLAWLEAVEADLRSLGAAPPREAEDVAAVVGGDACRGLLAAAGNGSGGPAAPGPSIGLRIRGLEEFLGSHPRDRAWARVSADLAACAEADGDPRKALAAAGAALRAWCGESGAPCRAGDGIVGESLGTLDSVLDALTSGGAEEALRADALAEEAGSLRRAAVAEGDPRAGASLHLRAAGAIIEAVALDPGLGTAWAPLLDSLARSGVDPDALCRLRERVVPRTAALPIPDDQRAFLGSPAWGHACERAEARR